MRRYSSLPTRISVSSTSLTTAASTRSRWRPGSARSLSMRSRTRGSREPNSSMRSNFEAVAERPPVRVVEVLLAAAGVAAGGLQVSPRVRADPDRGPGRRNAERPDARELAFALDGAAALRAIAEPAPGLAARDTGLLVRGVAQARGLRVGRAVRAHPVLQPLSGPIRAARPGRGLPGPRTWRRRSRCARDARVPSDPACPGRPARRRAGCR